MELVTQIQMLDEAVWISLHVIVFEKDKNPSVLVLLQ